MKMHIVVVGLVLAALILGPATGGNLRLQGHGDPVQFRNVWLLSAPKR